MAGNAKPIQLAAISALIFAACLGWGRAAPAENDTIPTASATAPQRLAPEPVTTKYLQITLDDLELLLSRLHRARQQMLAVICCIAKSDDLRGAGDGGQVFVGGERGAKSGVAEPRGIA